MGGLETRPGHDPQPPPTAAVCAALGANPGAATATIAVIAEISRPAARDALLAMETAGTATRVKGGKPGIPDTWTLAEPAPDGTGPADPEDEQPGQPDEDLGGSPDGAGEAETADGAEQERAAETGDPAPEDGGDAEAGTSAAPDPEAEQPEPDDAAPADGDHEDAVPGEQDDDEAAPDSGGPQDADGSDGLHDEDAPADADGEAGNAPDPALVTDLTERIAQIKAAADAAATVLTGAGT